MNLISKLRAAAVVLWLLLTGASGLFAQADRVANCPPETLDVKVEISVESSQREPGVYVFTPLCDGKPCDIGKFIFEWKFDEHDYSVQQRPERSFVVGEPRNVRLTLTGIKESDDPDSKYGGCPEEIIASGGCTGIILPQCTRPSQTVETTFKPKASEPRRHEEFGKQLDAQRGNFAMLLAGHDGNPVPLQRSQYPLVLQNRTSSPVVVITEVEGEISGTRHKPELSVIQGGRTQTDRRGNNRIMIETTLPPHTTYVMLIEVKIPDAPLADLLGQKLLLNVKSEFTQTGAALSRDRLKAEKSDLIQMAIDPSYLQLRTKHKITYGDVVRYRMVITNEGNLPPHTITILHELEPIWNRKKIKYTSFKINQHRIRKAKDAESIKGGRYYLHDKGYSDSTVVIAIQPKEKEGHALVQNTQLVIKFKVKIDKNKPDNWNGNTPEPGIRLKRKELFVHHAFWSHFDNESIWYRSNSTPPTVIQPKSWKVWRWVRAGVLIAIPIAVSFIANDCI